MTLKVIRIGALAAVLGLSIVTPPKAPVLEELSCSIPVTVDSLAQFRTLEAMVKIQEEKEQAIFHATEQEARDFERQMGQDLIEHAMKEQQVAISRGGASSEVLTGFEITFYNNDGISHTTKSGATTVDGVTIGVDPRVIPLGSIVEIALPDGRILERVAQDTGGAVKGRVIDVYADQPKSTLLKWGRIKNATVRILRRG